MAESFSTAQELERVLKEAIPRDWFEVIDVQSTGTELIVANRLDGKKRIFTFSIPGPEIAPALIEALLAPKMQYLVDAITSLVRASRLDTCWGEDIDSFAYQFYGDLLARRAGESDDVYKERLKCLLHFVYLAGTPNEEEFYFLPVPTDSGIVAFLQCFGFTNVYIPPTTPFGSLDFGFYWLSSTVTPPYNRSATTWSSASGGIADVPMVWSSALSYIIFVQDLGNEQMNNLVRLLVRKGKSFGITTPYVIATW